MVKIQLKDHLCFKLYVASRLIVQGYGEALKATGLTYPKYLVLLALEEKNGLSVGELGKLLYLDSGTLSPLLKSLLKQGYLERKRLAKDERAVLNFITPSGKKACQEGRKIAYSLFKRTGLPECDFVRLRSEMDDFVGRSQKILDKQRRGAVARRSSQTQSRSKKESSWSAHVH